MANEVPTFQLNDSTSIPAIGLGAGNPAADDVVKTAVLKALKNGYRHIDTASMYGTETGIGLALQEAFATGLVKREDLFVTTKIWCSELHPGEYLSAIKGSLSRLRLDYVNLYLIHWPIRLKQGTKFLDATSDHGLPLDLKDAWEALEEMVELGLTKSIGVSNFSVKRLQELLAHAKIVPAVNQVEFHPQWQQIKLRAYCQKMGIHLSAWSPLGAPGTVYGVTTVLDNPIIKELSVKYGKSAAQIILRWIYEQGFSSLPKSYNEGRQAENLSIWDFSLKDEDHEKIKTIEQSKIVGAEEFIKASPWRTFEEFWNDDE